MLHYVLLTVYIVTCLLLLLVVLLQQGRGGDIASAFGGGGSQTAFGARAGASFLTRAASVLGALFMLGSLLLAVIGRGGPASVVERHGITRRSASSAQCALGTGSHTDTG